MSPDSSFLARLADLALLAILTGLAAILTAAMVLQYAAGELPCPLCLLQRVAMFGVCFGIIHHFRHGYDGRNIGVSLVWALYLLLVSVRQVLLDIVPRPGHAYPGSAVLGLHMPVWSVIIAFAVLLTFAATLALFDGKRLSATPPSPGLKRRPFGWTHPNDKPSLYFQRDRASDRTQKSATFVSDALTRIGALAGLYIIALCLINLISAILQCGLGACHTTGYALL